MISKSLWHIDKNSSEIRTENVEELDSDLVAIKTQYSMVSTGTEFSVSSGLVSGRFADEMRVPYMNGSFSLPVKYGYACCGIDIEENLFHFMHPHQDNCLVQKNDLFGINELPARRVPLISNMETVINAIWDADFKDSDTIAIMGYGNIGSLLAQTISLVHNVNPDIIEQDDWRLQKATENGFIGRYKLDKSYNVIFNTTGSNNAINVALQNLNEEGKLIELSWYADRSVELKLGDNFHYNRLKIISSQVSKIPIKMRNKITYQQRKALAVDYLRDDRYDKLITDIIDFDDSPVFFKDLRENKLSKGLIYLFKY